MPAVDLPVNPLGKPGELEAGEVLALFNQRKKDRRQSCTGKSTFEWVSTPKRSQQSARGGGGTVQVGRHSRMSWTGLQRYTNQASEHWEGSLIFYFWSPSHMISFTPVDFTLDGPGFTSISTCLNGFLA